MKQHPFETEHLSIFKDEGKLKVMMHGGRMIECLPKPSAGGIELLYCYIVKLLTGKEQRAMGTER